MLPNKVFFFCSYLDQLSRILLFLKIKGQCLINKNMKLNTVILIQIKKKRNVFYIYIRRAQCNYTREQKLNKSSKQSWNEWRSRFRGFSRKRERGERSQDGGHLREGVGRKFGQRHRHEPGQRHRPRGQLEPQHIEPVHKEEGNWQCEFTLNFYSSLVV